MTTTNAGALDTALPERSLMARLPWRRLSILAGQIALLAVFLGAWQVLTGIDWFRKNTFLDPFFISRPSLIAQKLYDWTLGKQAGFLWPHLASTVGATLLGLAVAVVTGYVAGLTLSQNRALAALFNPFIVALNSLPRIAMVPLITMIFGLGLASKVVTAWFIVFFLIFFNAFKGGVNIEQHLINFCRTLGGSNRQITWTVRIPNSLAWTFAALPNAVSFSLIGVVISEFVGSTTGMGYLITTALATMNASDMFATITVLGIIGIVLVTLISMVERRLLHWAPEFRQS
ncbi:ABC transporter permease [uncultured Enterovirga sp.]|uniref:ABC transporter permease n=1 Tax=uncultured Enterovirga sp. TaxID=2026352 RepID=UPI0035C9AF79